MILVVQKAHFIVTDCRQLTDRSGLETLFQGSQLQTLYRHQ